MSIGKAPAPGPKVGRKYCYYSPFGGEILALTDAALDDAAARLLERSHGAPVSQIILDPDEHDVLNGDTLPRFLIREGKVVPR